MAKIFNSWCLALIVCAGCLPALTTPVMGQENKQPKVRVYGGGPVSFTAGVLNTSGLRDPQVHKVPPALITNSMPATSATYATKIRNLARLSASSNLTAILAVYGEEEMAELAARIGGKFYFQSGGKERLGLGVVYRIAPPWVVERAGPVPALTEAGLTHLALYLNNGQRQLVFLAADFTSPGINRDRYVKEQNVVAEWGRRVKNDGTDIVLAGSFYNLYVPEKGSLLGEDFEETGKLTGWASTLLDGSGAADRVLYTSGLRLTRATLITPPPGRADNNHTGTQWSRHYFLGGGFVFVKPGPAEADREQLPPPPPALNQPPGNRPPGNQQAE